MHHLRSCETTLIVNAAGLKLRNSYSASSTSNACGKLLPLGNAKEREPLSERVYSTLFEVGLEEHRSEYDTSALFSFSGTIDCIGSDFYTIYGLISFREYFLYNIAIFFMVQVSIIIFLLCFYLSLSCVPCAYYYLLIVLTFDTIYGGTKLRTQ